MMYAAGANKPEIISVLIKSGADVNAKNNFGDTPLMLVATENYHNPEAVKILLDANAYINARDKYGKTALIRTANSYSTKKN